MKISGEAEEQNNIASSSSHLINSPSQHSALYRVHAMNIAVIAAIVVAMFWRVFFLGETFVDVATLNNQLPWGYYAGQASDHQYNRRDLTDTYITRDYFVVASYRDGEMPLWNPYTMAGHPIYADGVTRTLSPFLLFYTFLDVPLGYSVARISELMLAAIFMYIFMIGTGAKPKGALMGSLVFIFSSHSLFHVTGLGWWGGLMWLPLILLFADRAARRNSFLFAVLAGVFLALQFYCGWMQNQIYYVGAVILYYLYFAFGLKHWRPERLRTTNIGNRLRALALMGTTIVLGFALSATQWLPVMELLRYSNRRIVPTELSFIYLPPWYLGTMIFPNLFGSAGDVRTLRLFTALNVSHDHILYIGIAALLPLGFCLYYLQRSEQIKNRDHIRFFALLAAFALFIMMAAPLYVHVTKFIPVLQVIRVIVRAWVLLIFAAAVLVGFGTDLLLRAESHYLNRFARYSRGFLYGVVAFALISVASSYILKFTGFAADTGESGRVAFLRKSAAALSDQFTPPNSDILIPLFFLIAVALLISWLASAKIAAKVFYAALVALLVVEIFWNGSEFNPTFDRSRVFPQTKITNLLRSLPDGRVLIAPSDLETNRRVGDDPYREKIIAPPNTLLPYEIATVTGKNQQFPKWYREFASLAEPQPYLSHVVFEQAGSRFLDLLNVRYLLTHNTRPAPEGHDLLATEEGVSLYENRNVLPRAFFVGGAIAVSSSKEASEVLGDPEFDTRSMAIIETGNDFNSQISRMDHETDKVNSSKATIIEDERNRVVISTENDKDGLLILSDNYYPGWQATVDGAPAQILRTNITMRAVRVPRGSHVVSFQFAPPVFMLSVYISIASAVVVFAVLIAAMIKRFRRPASQE